MNKTNKRMLVIAGPQSRKDGYDHLRLTKDDMFRFRNEWEAALKSDNPKQPIYLFQTNGDEVAYQASEIHQIVIFD